MLITRMSQKTYLEEVLVKTGAIGNYRDKPTGAFISFPGRCKLTTGHFGYGKRIGNDFRDEPFMTIRTTFVTITGFS